MLKKENFRSLLKAIGFTEEGGVCKKSIGEADLKVDFGKTEITYPGDLKVHRREIGTFSANENFVVFECVHRLLEKGYKSKHLELEPQWKVGHGSSGGRADILVKNQQNKPLLLIECKTAGNEFEKAWKNTRQDGGQLFGYAQQIHETQFLCLYASDFLNGEIHTEQRIISHTDNPTILEQNKKQSSFAKATDVKSRFAVWRDTYQLEYTENGIFENNVQPYQIGKSKYTLTDDTKGIGIADKKGKYHEFRTILRKHNIARRENAFEVLVNLFLCKIVDEEENKGDLKFYWKGIAYDNYFDFVDRLQDLYQKGMRKFLNEEISYISNEQIDDAFWTVKNKRNATKKQIQAYFMELKFFTNSAFSFVDTHNEELFNKNAKVLLEIVQMWQGLRLKTNEQNQFLGDMFEYFLDNSIKQSEGQFFTPLPICKFIVASLPLAQRIEANAEPPKVIDYACGVGHFLNEYAYQIKPLIEAQGQDPSDYYSHITGIEKEDRLAKVAKVAAYMYGQEQIKILDADALVNHPEVPHKKYDVLVANPPFAVEGFLQTLNDDDKKHYHLTKIAGETSNTSTIQCFFLERIQHLMAPGGVVGVIVPSSILSNSDAVHTSTRELLLQFFDLVCIAELGSGTFGKTGTNTVVLFLRRKAQKPEPAEHYQNRVEDFFEGDEQGVEYQDYDLIKNYCKHIEVPYDEYKKLFDQTKIAQLSKLLKYDIFKNYQTDFEQSTKIKNLKKSKVFKGKTKAKQKAELDQRFIAYLYAIEKDKLYYFMLAHEQAGEVLIVNSPKDNKEQKQFLGYEWSGAKGSEGIRYNGGETVSEIVTPLFDSKNLDNPDRINAAIKNNFIGQTTNPLPEHCWYAKLTDILDFDRKNFTKAITLNPQQYIDIETKWEQMKLGQIAEIVAGQSPKSNFYNGNKNGLPFYQGKKDFGEICITPPTVWTSKTTKESIRNDILFSVRAPVGDVNLNLLEKICIGRGLAAIRSNSKKCLQKYIFYFINLNRYLFQGVQGSTFEQISTGDLRKKKIPLPPLNIQQQIVDECEAVDKEVEQARQKVTATKQQIEKLVSSVKKVSRLNQVVERVSEIVNPKEEEGLVNYIGLENIESETGVALGNSQSDFSTIKSNKNIFEKGDILYGKLRPNLNKVYLADMNGICSTDILVLRPHKSHLAVFYKHYFLSKEFTSEVLKTVSGQQLPRTSWEKINKIPAPPLNVQKQLVEKVKKLEEKITQAQAIIDMTTERKKTILTHYL